MSMTYFINGDISESALNRFVEYVENRVPSNATTLRIMIKSCGGSVAVGLGWAHLLKTLPMKIDTLNLANVDSAAIPIFAVGERRFCVQGGTFLFHPIMRKLAGVYDEDTLMGIVREMKFQYDGIADLLSLCSGREAAYWRRCMRRKMIFDKTMAMACGLITTAETPSW